MVVAVSAGADLQKCTNHLENAFGRMGIHISKRAYNQLELFVGSFPGNCYTLNEEYDRFLTLSDAAMCLMYKERVLHSEETPLKIYYTDRQGVPVAIDITGKEGKNKLTDNSNFFCLGPSGSGKSFISTRSCDSFMSRERMWSWSIRETHTRDCVNIWAASISPIPRNGLSR